MTHKATVWNGNRCSGHLILPGRKSPKDRRSILVRIAPEESGSHDESL